MSKSDLKRTLLISAALTLFFCSCFVYLYPKFQRNPDEKKTPLILSSDVVGRPLPEVNFIDSDKKILSSEFLKNERAIIVVLSSRCSPCEDETSFLKTIVGKDQPIKFYGLLAYSDREDLFTQQDNYPFKLLYDESGNFIKQLEIDRTPIKIFCDHGVIKRVWVGSTTLDPDKMSFTNWLTPTS